MREFLTRVHNEDGGFTLVELLVVLSILAVFVAVVTSNFTSLFGRGELQTYNVEKKMVQSVIDAYMADNRVSAVTASTIKHGVIPNVELCSTCAGIASYFSRVTTWCWVVATNGKVTNSLDAIACGATPPAIPSGGTA